MKINIKATSIELTPAISEYVEKKISSVEKYINKEGAELLAQVEVGRITEHHKSGNVFRAEVHITGPGVDIYAASEQPDLYAAVDIVKDEVVHNAVQSKGKRLALARRGAEMVKNIIKGLSFKRRK